ncbi:MAG: two-component system, NarL family, nitrate/nitrite response regulator NarL [Solirubrobacteraceae bacterium]|jgi:DNA-binding NarL/FixJ family response regulator|nr:two-component system, NarL family, nitrate/nitrite response regulator NarL [Solirubrobacteraceae bacterium]
MKRLLIVGNDAFALHAMRFALNHTAGVGLVGVVHNTADLGKAVARARPDMIVIDGLTDVVRPLECLPDITAQNRAAMVIIVVARPDSVNSARAMHHGAIVCVWPKAGVAAVDADSAAAESGGTVTDLRAVQAAQEAAAAPPATHTPLTSRELETLRWVAQGHTNAWIARKLWVTEQTVKFHLSNIYRKLGVANRTEASHYAMVHRLLEEPERGPAAHAGYNGAVAQER